MKTPAESLCSSAVRVLLAVATQPGPTVQSVSDETGTAYSSTYHHLQTLRRAGLVDWVHGQSGTLRALVRFEPVGGGR